MKRKLACGNSYVVVGLVAAMAAAAPAAAAPGASVFKRMGDNVPLLDEGTRVILGRVAQVTMPPPPEPGRQVQFPVHIVYDAAVLCEYQERIAEHQTVRIEGQAGVEGSAPINIPLLAKGDLFVMAVRVTPEPDRYIYAGAARLPTGVETPTTVEPKKTDELKTALLRLGQVARDNRGELSREDALALAREHNEYLWALGVTGLSAVGTEDEARLLLQWFDDPRASLRRILWVEYCFEHVFPTQTRPALQERHRHLLHYLRRHAVAARGGEVEKGTKGKGVGNRSE